MRISVDLMEGRKVGCLTKDCVWLLPLLIFLLWYLLYLPNPYKTLQLINFWLFKSFFIAIWRCFKNYETFHIFVLLSRQSHTLSRWLCPTFELCYHSILPSMWKIYLLLRYEFISVIFKLLTCIEKKRFHHSFSKESSSTGTYLACRLVDEEQSYSSKFSWHVWSRALI